MRVGTCPWLLVAAEVRRAAVERLSEGVVALTTTRRARLRFRSRAALARRHDYSAAPVLQAHLTARPYSSSGNHPYSSHSPYLSGTARGTSFGDWPAIASDRVRQSSGFDVLPNKPGPNARKTASGQYL